MTNEEAMENEDCFLQGKQQTSIEKLKEKIAEFTNIKNLHFLLGAGVSSGGSPHLGHSYFQKSFYLSLGLLIHICFNYPRNLYKEKAGKNKL